MTDHSPHADADETTKRDHTRLELALMEQAHLLSHKVEQLTHHLELMQVSTIVQKLALLQCLPEGGVVVEVPENQAPLLDDGTRLTRIRVLVVGDKLDIEPA
jgi:hypothetical protein